MKGKKNGAEMERERDGEKEIKKTESWWKVWCQDARVNFSCGISLSLSLARSSTCLMKSCCPPVCVLASRRYPRICRDNKQVCLMCDRKAERRTGGEGDERTSPELFDWNRGFFGDYFCAFEIEPFSLLDDDDDEDAEAVAEAVPLSIGFQNSLSSLEEWLMSEISFLLVSFWIWWMPMKSPLHGASFFCRQPYDQCDQIWRFIGLSSEIIFGQLL